MFCFGQWLIVNSLMLNFAKSSSGQSGLPQESWQTLTMVLIVRDHPMPAQFESVSPTSLNLSIPSQDGLALRTVGMSLLRLIWLNLAILAALGLQDNAAFAQVFSGLQRPAGSTAAATGSHYFTIIGHIARPNCYHLPTASPALTTFVEFAGDLTRHAAGPIRIVRDGRSVQSTFYSENSTIRLLPGDVVVVDGKINQGRIILRGSQNPADQSVSSVNLAIVGVRDYPLVMTMPAERATVRWVTRQLGLDTRVADHVQVVAQRQTSQFHADTRLVTGTVLVFDPSYVDSSRLPDDLPLPVKAGRQTPLVAQPAHPVGPLVQQPMAGPAVNQYSAAPGRARVPPINSPVPPTAVQDEPSELPPEEQTFVKQLLTDPASVPLDEPAPEVSGRAFVSPRPAASEPASDSPASVNSASAAPAVDALEGGASPDADHSPEAPRPYTSVPAIPEPLQPLGSSRSSTAVDPAGDDGSTDDRESSGEGPSDDSSEDTTVPQGLVESGTGAGFSLALQGAGLAAVTAGRGDSTGSDGTSQSPEPGSGPAPVTPAGPIPPNDSGLMADAPSIATIPSMTAESRLLPPPPADLNWPVISILTVGFLGTLAAAFLIYSIASETPTPRTRQIDTSGRYWLDRMIENDIPVVEESVDYPHGKQLFGRPAPIQRIDAAHKSVPRPHFSMPGGRSGVLKENPAMPDASSPHPSGSESEQMVRIHSGHPSRKQSAAAIPEPHSVKTAAKQQSETDESGDAADASANQDISKVDDSQELTREVASTDGRSFRFDSGRHEAILNSEAAATSHATNNEHGSTPAPEASTGPQFLKKDQRGQRKSGRQPVAVQPSPIVVQGSNLLDRILSSVDQTPARTRQDAPKDDPGKHGTDERGNS